MKRRRRSYLTTFILRSKGMIDRKTEMISSLSMSQDIPSVWVLFIKIDEQRHLSKSNSMEIRRKTSFFEQKSVEMFLERSEGCSPFVATICLFDWIDLSRLPSSLRRLSFSSSLEGQHFSFSSFFFVSRFAHSHQRHSFIRNAISDRCSTTTIDPCPREIHSAAGIDRRGDVESRRDHSSDSRSREETTKSRQTKGRRAFLPLILIDLFVDF